MTDPATTGPQVARFDVVGLGESMLSLFRDADPLGFSWDIAGAESNVVRNCAALGLRTSWVSRLGTDVAGPLVHDAIAGAGVDTTSVVHVDDAPTGLMLKGPPEMQPRVQYYRSGSAASQMSPNRLSLYGMRSAIHRRGIRGQPSQDGDHRNLVQRILEVGLDRRGHRPDIGVPVLVVRHRANPPCRSK
jgi:hypothetical protein